MRYSTTLFIVSLISLFGVFIPLNSAGFIPYGLGFLSGFLLGLASVRKFIKAVADAGWVRDCRVMRSVKGGNSYSSIGGLAGITTLAIVGFVFGDLGSEMFASYCVGFLPSLFLFYSIVVLKMEKAGFLKYLLFVLVFISVFLSILFTGVKGIADSDVMGESVSFKFTKLGKQVDILFNSQKEGFLSSTYFPLMHCASSYETVYDIAKDDTSSCWAFVQGGDFYYHKRVGSIATVLRVITNEELTSLKNETGFTDAGGIVTTKSECKFNDSINNLLGLITLNCITTDIYDDYDQKIEKVSENYNNCLYPLDSTTYLYYSVDSVDSGSIDLCKELIDSGFTSIMTEDI